MSQAPPPAEPQTPPRHFRPLAAEARRVLLLVNRKAGSGRRREVVDQVAAALGKVGLTTTIVTDILALQQQSAELYAQGELRTVITAGGDGTFGAALNATPEVTPLAVLPMGTENLLGRYAGHTRNPQQVARLLTEGVVAPLDAGAAGERLFAMMLSAGFDAEVVRRVHGGRKGNITHLAYAAPIWSAVCGYAHPPFELRWRDAAGDDHALDTRWLFALNLPRYAMQLPIAPNATGIDGLIDVCAFRHGSLPAGLRYLVNVWFGRHEHLADCTTLRVPRLELVPSEGVEIPYQLDGDPGGFLPVDIRILPGRLNMVLDRAVATSWGLVPLEKDVIYKP